MNFSNLIIFGARSDGGVSTLMDRFSERRSAVRVLGFADDAISKGRSFGLPILGNTSEVCRAFQGKKCHFLVVIGNNAVRKKLFLRALKAGLKPYTFIDESCTVSASAQVGRGCILFPRVTINGNTQIGDNVIINTASVIEHDNRIGAHSNICPGTVTSGRVKISEGAYLGTGTVVLPDIRIGKFALVGAGSVVTSDVSARSTVMGVPAKPTRSLK